MDIKWDPFLELQIVRPCFTKRESAVVGGGIQDFYDTYVLCKYDSRKGKAHSNLEVPKSKIIQEDKGIFARCPVLI